MHNAFLEFIFIKIKINDSSHLPSIKEGEIWWCSVGQNVGVEINGKGKVFTRPVLVYKKLSCFGFMGIPLTSKEHAGSWYVGFSFKNRLSMAALAQARVFSTSRLHKKMGALPENDFRLIQDGFKRLYIKNYP